MEGPSLPSKHPSDYPEPTGYTVYDPETGAPMGTWDPARSVLFPKERTTFAAFPVPKSQDPLWDEPHSFPVPFKYYGNYGGPRYSSGKFDSPPEEWTKKPVDILDEAFYHHDLAYVSKRFGEADWALVKELLSLSPTMTWAQLLAALPAAAAFSVKGLYHHVMDRSNPHHRPSRGSGWRSYVQAW